MKLATYRDGSRDGQLVVVSRDLTLAHFAAGIASRLGQVLDDWGFRSAPLEDLYATLNGGKARHAFPFDPARCLAPWPRPTGVTRWRGGTALPGEPGAERLGGPRESCWGDDPGGPAGEPGIAFITGDLPAGATPGQALDGVRLLTLAVDLRSRGTPQAGLATALGPVALTPDELDDDWHGGQLHRPLAWTIDPADAALDVTRRSLLVGIDLGAALAQCARHRPVPAGHVLIALAGPDDDPPSARRLRLEWTGRNGSTPFGMIDLALAGAP